MKCSCGAEYQNGSGRKKRCDECQEKHLKGYMRAYLKEYMQRDYAKERRSDYTIQRILDGK